MVAWKMNFRNVSHTIYMYGIDSPTGFRIRGETSAYVQGTQQDSQQDEGWGNSPRLGSIPVGTASFHAHSWYGTWGCYAWSNARSRGWGCEKLRPKRMVKGIWIVIYKSDDKPLEEDESLNCVVFFLVKLVILNLFKVIVFFQPWDSSPFGRRCLQLFPSICSNPRMLWTNIL